MCKRRQRFIGLSLGIIALLSTCVAFAQGEMNDSKACSMKKASGCMASGKAAAGCSQAKTAVCKAASSGCASGALMCQVPVYMDSPAALLAQADKLRLTDEQKASLNKILANARKEAVAVLNDEQRTKLGDVPDKPVIGCQGVAKACASDCNKPCWADKSKVKACGPGCTKPCCAKKSAAVEQTICPVMGAPINKQLYTEYEGKKVYFCCPGCKAKFEADPKKYLDKLPQFKK